MTRRHWFGTPAPIYAWIVPLLQKEAQRHGYVIALHGSMQFDLDLVAIPWTDDAVAAAELVAHLCCTLGITKSTIPGAAEFFFGPPNGPEPKPHGRQAWSLPIGMGLYVDISVIPPHDRIDAALAVVRERRVLVHDLTDDCRTAHVDREFVTASFDQIEQALTGDAPL